MSLNWVLGITVSLLLSHSVIYWFGWDRGWKKHEQYREDVMATVRSIASELVLLNNKQETPAP